MDDRKYEGIAFVVNAGMNVTTNNFYKEVTFYEVFALIKVFRPLLGLAYAPIVETSFPELVMCILDFSS